ncbi:bromodomain adjacent to zinc finger domain protein 1A-like [Tigriopus californicus]|uniref:bromodomain adjacent to zinc finger domain protein 1A-like n=1 Tax=Tigriopus californicus TaxID=6832 RepID=UPI0027DA20F0|nr:bromodomain adjacent to zinc finger domain protein 1A-like [Tigriopus californicus]XP_059088370.1 bromodomain adjacent to zinc finger domain protein 1A-like [Tigriopus californicus]
MPLLRKNPFQRAKPPRDLRPEEEVFFCEATKEIFRDYEEFFQRTILCNSLVWSCAITGKANLTYEEAVESERKAKKRLGTLPKPLKRGLLWLAHRTSRGRLAEVVDDVYVFASARYFKGEVVEAVIQEQWCDCKVVGIIPPTEAEIENDRIEEEEERQKDLAAGKTPAPKPRKSFSPPEYLFKYELEEIEPDDPEVNQMFVVEADDVRREKGFYTREKNLLFLKNVVHLGKTGNFQLKREIVEKYHVEGIKFSDIFNGPPPKFDESKRLKGPGAVHHSSKSKKEPKSDKKPKKPTKMGKNQGTLDSWVKGDKSQSAPNSTHKVKKQSSAELEAEMKKIREQNARFKEEMKLRAEEARKRKIEDKAKEKERKKEEQKLLKELMNEWKKRRDDLECDDLKELPRPTAIHCKIPNPLFGEFLTLLEFIHCFHGLLETHDSFPNGVTFDILEQALTDKETLGGSLFDVLSFLLGAVFDLQDEEDNEVRLDKITVNPDQIDKNVLGKDEDVANHIRLATAAAKWPFKTQGGQKLRELHLDQYTITEILRLHLQSGGAFRSEKLIMWLYQQRGGYRLSDDPALQLKMDDPQILEALTRRTVFELSCQDKLKILTVLMQQILTYATVRDEIDEKLNEYHEAKSELREHKIAENKRQRILEESEKQRKKEEKGKKKDTDSKAQENALPNGKEEHPPTENNIPLTERQRLALQTQKEKEEKDRIRKEEIKRSEAWEREEELKGQVFELQFNAGMNLLGRDRAYRRYWMFGCVPGVFVEHDDDTVGPCMGLPTPYSEMAGPMDEETAIKRVQEILDAKDKTEEKSSSDKENDQDEKTKTYSKKQAAAPLKQKVLSTNNGSVDVTSSPSSTSTNPTTTPDVKPDLKSLVQPHEMLPWGACLASDESCPVHSSILPRTHWAFFKTTEEIDNLIDNLNDRGIRESGLKEKLVRERERIAKSLKKFNMTTKFCKGEGELESKKHIPQVLSNGTKEEKGTPKSATCCVELTLRDQILELEEKIFFGTLGTLKIRDRSAWQQAISEGGFDKQCDTLKWGGMSSLLETPADSRLQSGAMSKDSTRPGTPNGIHTSEDENRRDSGNSFADKELGRKVTGLASAILQVGQMVDRKYIKPPLGEDEKEKKKRLKEEEKRNREREAAEDVTEELPLDSHKDHILTPFEEWESSLMASKSFAQLFIHMTTLENSIVWSKSLLNAKCRLCRRKNDPENMLLCDGCDRGHHMYCLKPKLKSIPEGDWFCHECKPKERIRTPKKKSRRVFIEDEEENVEDSQEEDENEETAEAGEEEEEEAMATEHVDEEDGELQDESNEDQGDETMEVDEVDSETEDPEHDSAEGEDLEEDDEDSRPRKRRGKASPVQVKPKKEKKNSKTPSISQLLGKRRSAAEASEKIALATQAETNSGNSSGSEEIGARSSSTRSRRSANKRSMEATLLEQQHLESLNSQQSARSKRRRAVDDAVESMFNPTVLEDLLNAMMKHKDGWPFDRPITKADAPDYHKIIKKPMDLGTIRSSINRMKYTCNQEVVEDIRQVFENCWTYNRDDAEEYQCGVRLEKFFNKEAKKLGLLYESEDNDDDVPLKPAKKKSRRTY